MVDIVCPHCKRIFRINESEADSIKEQIRTQLFEQEVNDRVASLIDNCKTGWELEVAENTARIKEEYQAEIDLWHNKATQCESQMSLMQKQNEIDRQQARDETKIEYLERISSLETDKLAVEHERDYYKDLRMKMSTKMIGESLEKYCENEFNKIRMTAFPNAEFEKDNKISKSGSKGDYIFREYADGVELLSIMFEMKTEMETTATKKTNESFFKELDKDRKEKNCEYAVLVSTLEADNDFYNQGISDVSWKYPKMFVIRPQCFISFISILRNASLNALEARKELFKIQNQNIDVKNFETALDDFKSGFEYNYEQADKRLGDAVKEIDKAIANLNNTKESLLATSRQMRLANDKLNSLTIKKLASDSPSLRDQFSSEQS